MRITHTLFGEIDFLTTERIKSDFGSRISGIGFRIYKMFSFKIPYLDKVIFKKSEIRNPKSKIAFNIISLKTYLQTG